MVKRESGERLQIPYELKLRCVELSEYTNKAADLFQDFVLDFPKEFADATVREIHTGHLHRESVDNGTMVRRLASGVPTDAWNSKNGFVGANKRFQLFEWEPGALAGIKYV